MDGRVRRAQVAEIYYGVSPDGAATIAESIVLKGRTGITEISDIDLQEWVEYHTSNGGKLQIKEVISVFYDQQ